MIDNDLFKSLKTHITVPSHQREDSFINSIAYYMLTGRRGAWVCENQTAKAVVCRHPNMKDRLLIFPEIGHGDGSLIADIIRTLDLSKQSAQLARFTDQEVAAVQSHLHKNSSINITLVKETQLDWYYPVHILDTAQVSHLNGPNFRNIRQKLRKIDELNVHMIGLNDEAAMRYLYACTKYWEGNQILYNSRYQTGDSAFYQTLFSLINTHPDLFDGFIIRYGNRVGGFSIWDQTTTDTTNLIANLVDIHISGLSEYQLVMTCRLLHEKGIQFLNRGGSERVGLHNFKQKFAPVKTIDLVSALVEKSLPEKLYMAPLITKPIEPSFALFS